jgi:hypothetical protein
MAVQKSQRSKSKITKRNIKTKIRQGFVKNIVYKNYNTYLKNIIKKIIKI